MQRYELEAWLGPTLNELTTEQIARLQAEEEEISRRYPERIRAGRDFEAERAAALSAAVQYLLGELAPQQAGAELTRAQLAAVEARAAARQVARMAAIDGTPKAAAAREAGIDRMVLLRDLGERDR